MKKTSRAKRTSDGMRVEYDFSGGVRGKYAARYRAGTNVVMLVPGVAATFKDAEAVNRALRAILAVVPVARRLGAYAVPNKDLQLTRALPAPPQAPSQLTTDPFGGAEGLVRWEA